MRSAVVIVNWNSGLRLKSCLESLPADADIVVVDNASEDESMRKAREWIESIVAKPEVGKVYDGKVTRIIPGVGAIVEFLGGKDGMVHISELQWQRTEQVEDVVQVGQALKIQVIEHDPIEGRTRLSLKRLTEAPPDFQNRPPQRPSFGGGRPMRR